MKDHKNINRMVDILTGILIILLLIVITFVERQHVLSHLRSDMMKELKDLSEALTENYNQYSTDLDNYIKIQQNITNLAAYYLNHLDGLEDPGDATKDTLDEIADVLSAEDVYITDGLGNVLSTSNQTRTPDFTGKVYLPLLEVSPEAPVSDLQFDLLSDDTDFREESESVPEETGQPAAAAPEEISGTDGDATEEDPYEELKKVYDENTYSLWYCISAYLAPDRVVVIHDNMSDFEMKSDGSDNVYDLLSRTSYSYSGFYFLVQSYEDDNLMPPLAVIGYKESDPDKAPNNLLTPEELGLPEDSLQDHFSGFLMLDGQRYYCCTRAGGNPDCPSFLYCVLPATEVWRHVFFASAGPMAMILLAILLMRMYALFLLADRGKTAGGKKAGTNESSDSRHYLIFRRKMGVLLVLCLCVTAGCSIFSKTLYLYTSQIRANSLEARSLQSSVEALGVKGVYGSGVYRNAVEILTRTAASLISKNREFSRSEKLRELADVLGVKHILVYNKSGTVVASDLNYTGLDILNSDDPLISDFRWILYGEPILVQDQINDTYLHHPYIFSGAPVVDENGVYDGIVQLAFSPDFRNELVVATSLSSTLSSYGGYSGTVALSVDTETKTVYSSEQEYNLISAEELGLAESELQDGYMGFLELQYRQVLGACRLGGGYWNYVTNYTAHFPLRGIRYGVVTMWPGIIAELLYFLFLLLYGRHCEHLPIEGNRVLMKYRKQEALAAESALIRLFRMALFAVACVITTCSLVGKTAFGEKDFCYYIFVYPWTKGIHIFTISRCLIGILVTVFVLMVAQNLLLLLCTLLPSRQETVLRMLLSFVKYIGAIGMIFFCLNLVGVSAASLAASAGLLTVVLSFGAQNMIADILAGLLIIFEGTFKVGDMIRVGDWYGQVVEIGIRNTTIHDLLNNDIRIMNNSTIKAVINYSVYPSYSSILVGIPYEADIREIEAMVEREKPVIKKNIPLMIGELRFLGVDQFADSAVCLKFEVACRNQDFQKVRRALNREIWLMLGRNGISIPYPHVTLQDEREGHGDDESREGRGDDGSHEGREGHERREGREGHGDDESREGHESHEVREGHGDDESHESHEGHKRREGHRAQGNGGDGGGHPD